MKARRLKDNEIVDVIRYEKPINRDEVYVDGKLRLYLPSDLDFLPEKETAVLEGWVARDEDGLISLFDTEPERIADCVWAVYPGHTLGIRLPDDSFPSVTWLTEPKKVRITLEAIEE